MNPVKFNDTAEYLHTEIFGIAGVYSTQNIDSTSLPSGYSLYYLQPDGEDPFGKICKKAPGENVSGVFITQEKLSLGLFGSKQIGADDVTFPDRTFNMESFFGTKESIDLQIAQAEQRRDAQSGMSQSKDKSVTHTHTHDDEEFL